MQAEVYKLVLAEAWSRQSGHLQDERKQLTNEIKMQQEKLSYISDLLASRQIDPDDIRRMKSDYAAKLEKLDAKFNAVCSYSQRKIQFNRFAPPI